MDDSEEKLPLNECPNCRYLNLWTNVQCHHCGQELTNALPRKWPDKIIEETKAGMGRCFSLGHWHRPTVSLWQGNKC